MADIEKQKLILNTGATGSIAGGAALALAKRGVEIVLLGRKAETLKARAKAIYTELDKAQFSYNEKNIEILTIDFTDMKSVRKAAEEVLRRFPVIDGLILSVGQLVQNGPNVLPNGHELMFATSVLGPFLFANLLMERMQQSNSMVLQVIAPFYNKMNWNDIESIKNHNTTIAYNRAKTCERVMLAELARRYSGKITSVAFDPSFIIDKSDPELKKRWPKGYLGFIWWMFCVVLCKTTGYSGSTYC